MSAERSPLDALREAREAIAQLREPAKVDLREYVSAGSPAWRIFVDARRVPGRRVRRKTLLRWLDEVIGELDGAAIDIGEQPSPVPLPPTPAAPDPPPPETATPPAPPEHASPPAGEPLRQLTSEGIEKALAFLADLRENPERARTPPDELLYDSRYSRPFNDEARVERREFRTRREAGEYLADALAPCRHLITDHAGVWSWLGMYYFESMFAPLAGRKWTIAREAVAFSSDESTTAARRSYQRRYRHCLRGAWLLYEQQGEKAAFLLDEDITTFGTLADRLFSDFRAFSSEGVVPLALRLYATGAAPKPLDGAGGLRHLLRVLSQLELTYDVYGMEPDALLEILPPVFKDWDRAGAAGVPAPA